jgi:hypothetical protein
VEEPRNAPQVIVAGLVTLSFLVHEVLGELVEEFAIKALDVDGPLACSSAGSRRLGRLDVDVNSFDSHSWQA